MSDARIDVTFQDFSAVVRIDEDLQPTVGPELAGLADTGEQAGVLAGHDARRAEEQLRWLVGRSRRALASPRDDQGYQRAALRAELDTGRPCCCRRRASRPGGGP